MFCVWKTTQRLDCDQQGQLNLYNQFAPRQLADVSI